MIHSQYGENIARDSSCDSNEWIHENRSLDRVVTQILMAVRAAGNYKSCHLANGRLLWRVYSFKLIETVEKLWEPHHKTVIAAKQTFFSRTNTRPYVSIYPMWNVKLIVIEISVNRSMGDRNSCLLLSHISLHICLIHDVLSSTNGICFSPSG